MGNVAEEITRFRDVRSEFEQRSGYLSRLTLLGYFSICVDGTRNAHEPNSVPTDADETSIAGGHRGVHISCL